ncbi:hypothetical protein [Mycolicibacterium goodii]|uniref:PE-PGRS family protein n=1 Tax=Mycolicibacterium goodii TaxID=134601 RepID=A0ABS6HW92_MYCGD|nr:hypothetical protein [Mycolicibacterium goodii]MBU8825667.1 hypothetical protein [Mycolicibacterium goodii]MBU8836439.1 hypothetical protein [Mycolicibacterium goodii]
MAVRPLVTTGAALLSAGALVAATPALFVPNDEVKVAATAPAPATKSMTVEQLKLLATLQEISDAFFQGYGGFATGEKNGDCGADDAVCPAGFVGVPYLLIDEALPNTLIDNYFFETGFVGTAEYILESAGVDATVRGLIFRPVETISQLIAEGAATATGEDSFITGLTTAFLIDYKGNLGFVGAINYIVDTIIQGAPPVNSPFPEEESEDAPATPNPEDELEDGAGDPGNTAQLVSNTTETQQGNALTRLARSLGVGPSSTEIGTGTLVDVNTGTEEEAETSEDLAAGEVGTGAEDETAGSGTGVTTPVANTGGTTPVANTGGTTTTDPEGSTAPEGETGATPTGATTGGTEVKTQPVNETKTETETEDTKTVDTKGGNKVTPGVIFETGHKGGGGSGGWINDTINTLKKAFNGGGKTTQKPADTNDGGADNGGSEGGGDE